jgi:hypothetical protein
MSASPRPRRQHACILPYRCYSAVHREAINDGLNLAYFVPGERKLPTSRTFTKGSTLTTSRDASSERRRIGAHRMSRGTPTMLPLGSTTGARRSKTASATPKTPEAYGRAAQLGPPTPEEMRPIPVLTRESSVRSSARRSRTTVRVPGLSPGLTGRLPLPRARSCWRSP